MSSMVSPGNRMPVLSTAMNNNLGFWVGREGGYRLLRRYGVHAVLSAWAAFLTVAGTDRRARQRFLFFTAACAPHRCAGGR